MNWLLWFIPHFVTEDIAAIKREDGLYYLLCLVQYAEEHEYDHVITVRSLAFLNYGLFPSLSKIRTKEQYEKDNR